MLVGSDVRCTSPRHSPLGVARVGAAVSPCVFSFRHVQATEFCIPAFTDNDYCLPRACMTNIWQDDSLTTHMRSSTSAPGPGSYQLSSQQVSPSSGEPGLDVGIKSNTK